MQYRLSVFLVLGLVAVVPTRGVATTWVVSVPDMREFVSANRKFVVQIHTVRGSGGTPDLFKAKGVLIGRTDKESGKLSSWQLDTLPRLVFVTDDGNHVIGIDEFTFAAKHALVVYDRKGNMKVDCHVDDLIPREERPGVAMPGKMDLIDNLCKITNDQFTARTERGRVIEVDLKTYKVRTYLENKLSDALWIIAVVIGGTVALLALVWAAMKFLSRFLPAEPVP